MVIFYLVLVIGFFHSVGALLFENGGNIENDRDIFKGSIHQISPRTMLFENTLKTGKFHSRLRRQISNKVKINFINKSGRRVRVYASESFGYFGYLRRQFDLRPNEPRGINTWVGSLWIVRDIETGVNMLINGKVKYLVKKPLKRDEFLDLKIRNPPFLQRKMAYIDFKQVGEKFLRVILVTDSTVTNHYGRNNVKKYILTLMNIVSKIFKDKSLGIKINIIVTKVHIMETDPLSYKIKENDPDASITNACQFASTLKNEHSNHNFAIVLTRKPIGPSGYAAMYTMCTEQSCALVKESGFSTAYVIAHETGHALGIDHDGEDMECEEDKLQGSIMAPKVYSKHERYHWSKCSKRSLFENIRYFPCLNKKPSNNENNEVAEFIDLPGEMFTKSDQCRHRLGKQASACYVYYGACLFLWCRLGFWAPCRALATTSPLEGTFCGTDKWCIKGKCVSNKYQSINGMWSKWSEFSNCKGVCGAGIKIRKRKCDNPAPRYGGRPCDGKDNELLPCKLKNCEPMEMKTVDRRKRCKQKLGEEYINYDVKEVAKYLKEANINCNFENGTCGWKKDNRHRLDWALHSGPTRSSGTGPSYDHTYRSSKGHYVYFETSWVKAHLRPVAGDSAKIASSLISTPSVCFSFYYHMYGDNVGSLKVLTASKEKSDTVWNMKGSQGDKWRKAKITIQHGGPYQIVFEAIRGAGYRGDIAVDDIEIRLGSCSQKVVAGSCTGHCFSTKKDSIQQIEFEDGTPCFSNKSYDVCYQGKCQKIGCDYQLDSRKQIDACGICGGDNSTCKLLETKRTITAEKTFQEVFIIPEGSENITIKIEGYPRLFGGIYLDDRNATNVFNTDGYRWPTGNYSVNKNTFLYQRDAKSEVIKIVRLVYQGCGVVIFNPFAKEVDIGLPKTKVTVSVKLPVTKEYNQFEYVVKSWTECSKSCGGGVQHPILVCMEKKTERQLSDLYCSDIISPDVELSRACNIQPCQQRFRYTRRTGQWSSCSTSCGLGQRTREVRCFDKDLRIHVNKKACQNFLPIASQSCYLGPCTGLKFITESWNKCSKSCGIGIQRRRVFCAINNNSVRRLSLAACPGEFPVTARLCNIQPCRTFEWVSYNFGSCSATCGGGVQIKMISCRHVRTGVTVYNYLCPEPRPFVIDDCNVFPC